MNLICRLGSFAVAVLVLGLAPGICRAQAPRADGMLRFASGDSVELITSGPIQLASGTTGLVLQYHPFVPVEESSQLKKIATQLWRWLRPKIDTNPPPFVVLTATTGRANPPPGLRKLQNYNYVVERRADGQWYFTKE